MEVELLNFIIAKAYKIYLYEQQPRTDEQYLKRKNTLEMQYDKAKNNYLSTSDTKYKKEMSRLKEFLSYNVSQTEYELCKKDLEHYKSNYKNEIDEKYWNYLNLIEIDMKIKLGEAKSVKEAVKLYEAEIVDLIKYYNEAF